MAQNPHQPATRLAGIAGWISETEYLLEDGTVVRPEPHLEDGVHARHPVHGTPLYRRPHDGELIHHGVGVPEVPPEQRPPDLTRRSEYREYLLGAGSLAEWEDRKAHVLEANGGRRPMFFDIDCIRPDHILMPPPPPPPPAGLIVLP